MYDYSLHLQAKQRIEDIRRENLRRHWLRDILNGVQPGRVERDLHKPQASRSNANHE